MIENVSIPSLSMPSLEMEEELSPYKQSTKQSKQCIESVTLNSIADEDESKYILDNKSLKKLTGWKVQKGFNHFVKNTSILPVKVFLQEEKWLRNLKDEERHTLEDVHQYCKRNNKQLDVIIDLNRSYDYYNFEVLRVKHPYLAKTKYYKFCLENAEIPEQKFVDEIYKLLVECHKSGKTVVIHCFNGINRTGFMICYFLCKYLGLDSKDAVKEFGQARGHEIYHKVMVDYLEQLFPESEDEVITQNL